MRISDWSSDVCSSDLVDQLLGVLELDVAEARHRRLEECHVADAERADDERRREAAVHVDLEHQFLKVGARGTAAQQADRRALAGLQDQVGRRVGRQVVRSEEHTSELQSLMRISDAVFCLKKKNK